MSDKTKKENKENKHSFSRKVKEFIDNDEALEKEIDIGINELDAENNVESQEEDEIKKLTIALDESKLQCVDYLDKLKRNMAEFDNYRKRTMKEKSGMYEDGIKDTMEKLIPVLDNFELALNTATNKEDNFYKGVEMILRQFQSVMFDAGIEEIPALGQTFDPKIHNAVTHVADEAFGESEIVEEMRKGYSFKNRVIRHSMVKVAN